MIRTATIAREHAADFPLVYATGDELRDRDELDRIVSQIKTRTIPVTTPHPSTLLRFGAKDARIVGRILDAWIADHEGAAHVFAKLQIDDESALDGNPETSIGYMADLDGNRYQRNIDLDHLSLIPAGRCRTCWLLDGVRHDCTVTTPAYRTEIGSITTALFDEVAERDRMIRRYGRRIA